MADALIAVGKAQELATAFSERIRAGGAGDWPVIFGPLGICRLGVPENQRSVFASWLTGAVLSGALDINTIPSSWRQSWGMLADVSRAKGDAEQLRVVTSTVRRLAAEASAPSTRSRAAQVREGW